MNLYELSSPDITQLEEKDRGSLLTHLRWRRLVETNNPQYLRYLCRHGVYIGHNGLFGSKCHWCRMEGII